MTCPAEGRLTRSTPNRSGLLPLVGLFFCRKDVPAKKKNTRRHGRHYSCDECCDDDRLDQHVLSLRRITTLWTTTTAAGGFDTVPALAVRVSVLVVGKLTRLTILAAAIGLRAICTG